nr:STAS-like domain-containing protein [Planctomycetota bacterium]
IVDALRQGKDVCLSFMKAKDLTSAFLNTAVGRLYGEYSEDEIREHLLPPTDMLPGDLTLLKRVVDRAKEFFKEPDRFTNATNQILGTDDDDPQQDDE